MNSFYKSFKRFANFCAMRYNYFRNKEICMIDISNKSLKGYTFIDLFAGLGGFRLALESLGAKCVYSNEWDKFAQEVYKNNFLGIVI